MEEWQDFRWRPFYGGFNGTGRTNNILCGGSPDPHGPHGVSLAQAHQTPRIDGKAGGYGRGVGLKLLGRDQEGHIRVRIWLNLVTWSMNDYGVIREDSPSYSYDSGTYLWRASVTTSSDGNSWGDNLVEDYVENVFHQSSGRTYYDVVFSHPWRRAHIYSTTGLSWPNQTTGIPQTVPPWTQTAHESQWDQVLTLPPNTRYLRIALAGRSAFGGEVQIFPFDLNDIFPELREYRPMAIRQDNRWLSLNRDNGFLDIRRDGDWDGIDLISRAYEGVRDHGSSQMRQDDHWYAQSEIGE